MKAEDPDPREERRWRAYWRAPVQRWTASLIVVLLTAGVAWGLTREADRRHDEACSIVHVLLDAHPQGVEHDALVRLQSDVC